MEITNGEDGPVFSPNEETFSDFLKCIYALEQSIAPEYGVIKVAPPASWVAGTKDPLTSRKVITPFWQMFSGGNGLYTMRRSPGEPCQIGKFLKAHSGEITEEEFWKGIDNRSALYGSDVDGTLMTDAAGEWNLAQLKHLAITKEITESAPGILTPFLYAGTPYSTFGLHTEDGDLYSISYLHTGKPKTWYGVPASEKSKLESLGRKHFPRSFNKCPLFIQHRQTIIDPKMLEAAGITVTKVHSSTCLYFILLFYFITS